MKRMCLLVSAFLCGTTPLAWGEDGFHIYAPSRITGKLLIVQGTPSNDGLSLKLVEDVDLGIPAATIAMPTIQYPTQPPTRFRRRPSAANFVRRRGDACAPIWFFGA